MQKRTELTLQILFVEDSIEDFVLIETMLRKEFGALLASRVDNRKDYLMALESTPFDLIICDHNMPQFDSDEALQCLQHKNLDIPFILVTGAISDQAGVAALRKGATDYVFKSNLAKLPLVLRGVLQQSETIRLKKWATSELARRNEELSKINKELDSFVYSVSHNLRSPLRSVLGLLQLAKNEVDPTALEQYHQMMETSIAQLDNTLQGILDYSRNARQDLKIEKVDLRSLIEETFDKMAFMPEFKNFSIEISIDQSVEFYSDRYRLSVVFANLISNAIKYSDKRKSASFIKIKGSVQAHQTLIEFSDNGIGIHQSALESVFKMFYRATDSAEGSGIGLHIVKEAIDILKGLISVESTVNVGTSFRIMIPNSTNNDLRELDNSLLVDKYS